jgi:hypothetical protein
VEVLAKEFRTQAVRRFALSELMFSQRARLLTQDLDIETADSEKISPPLSGRLHLNPRADKRANGLLMYGSSSPGTGLVTP